MHMIHETFDTAVVVRLRGPLNAQTSPGVRHEMEKLLLPAPKLVVLDLQDVPDMDSSGVGMLIWALKRVRTQGGDMRILHLRGMVQRLFDLLHLDRTMRVCDRLEDAIVPA